MNHYARTLENIVETGHSGDWKYCLSDDALFPIPPHLDIGLRNSAGQWWAIERHANGDAFFRVRRLYAWDGASFAPDFAKGARNLGDCLKALRDGDADAALAMAGPLVGSLVHDAGYQFVCEISAALDWGTDRTLTWADGMFLHTMLACGTPRRRATLYHFAVATVGHAYNAAGRFFRWIKRDER